MLQKAKVRELNGLCKCGTLENGQIFLFISRSQVAIHKGQKVFTGSPSQIKDLPSVGEEVCYVAGKSGRVSYWCSLQEAENAQELRL